MRAGADTGRVGGRLVDRGVARRAPAARAASVRPPVAKVDSLHSRPAVAAAAAKRFSTCRRRHLYGFLVDQNYLMGNPWSAVGQTRTSGPRVIAGRNFSLAQWQFIEDQLKIMSATSATRRPTFGLHLLYPTGVQLSEVVAARVDDLQWVQYPADAFDDQPVKGWLLQ